MIASVKAPRHLWIVGGLAALWNGFGCFDYIMTQTGNAAHLAQMTAEQMAFLENAPALLHGSWALGVWGGLAGSLLLLARSRHAVAAFIVSLIGLAVNSGYQLTLTNGGPHLDSSAGMILHLGIWAIAIGLLVYALRMRSRGVLR